MPASHYRYARQVLLPQVGAEGQARLAAARVLVVGLGALGSVAADLLVRAGVGAGDGSPGHAGEQRGKDDGGGGVTLLDRDVVEVSNLQRQTLYAQSDVGRPKAEAAFERLRAVNPDARLTPVASDLHSGNVAELLTGHDLVLDCTDNAATRYLINDAVVDGGAGVAAWVYGGAVGSEARVTAFKPDGVGRGSDGVARASGGGVENGGAVESAGWAGVGGGAGSVGGCLRCLFRTPPAPGELATCDTAGVFNAATSLVGAIEAQLAMRLLVEPEWTPDTMVVADLWTLRMRSIDLSDARDPDCPCCAHRKFTFLHAPPPAAVSLCGRDTLQVLPPSPRGVRLDLIALAGRWKPLGTLHATRFMLRLTTPEGLTATAFPDGRLLLSPQTDPHTARAWYDRLIGS